MHFLMTAGAIRTLELALILAGTRGKSQFGSAEVLWSLVLLESRAAEILATHGVNPQQLAELYALPAAGFDEQVISAALALQINANLGLPEHLTQCDCVQNILREIQTQLRTGLVDNEIGTEHLLYGLIASDPSLEQALRGFGLTLTSLRPKLVEESLELPRIETDFTLAHRTNREGEDQATLRILDAAANRVREGLRVLEDFVRFALDDAHLSKLLKTWRHELSHALQRITPIQLLSARETEQDVGTQIHTLTEARRSSQLDVVQANFKRVEEATRTLEEFGKIISADLGHRIGQLRYEIYTLEKSVFLTHFARERLANRNLYLLITEELCHHGSGPAFRGAIEGGVGIVQLREKRMNDRELVARGRRFRAWTREANVLLIMNDRPDLAVLIDADGVHVGQEELTVKDARRIVGPDRLVGVSTHTIEQARQAVRDGADYIGVGPVFSTSTKQFQELAGLEFVRQVADEIRLPAYAIGGIHRENIHKVTAAGAQRVAVSGAICSAANPQEAATDLKAALGT